jgi:hypothetical protein
MKEYLKEQESKGRAQTIRNKMLLLTQKKAKSFWSQAAVGADEVTN